MSTYITICLILTREESTSQTIIPASPLPKASSVFHFSVSWQCTFQWCYVKSLGIRLPAHWNQWWVSLWVLLCPSPPWPHCRLQVAGLGDFESDLHMSPNLLDHCLCNVKSIQDIGAQALIVDTFHKREPPGWACLEVVQQLLPDLLFFQRAPWIRINASYIKQQYVRLEPGRVLSTTLIIAHRVY